MLTQEDIIQYINILKIGGTLERPKLELKREWWKLDTPEGKMEFLKDITGMVNTPGDNGYFIIGIDGISGDIFNSPLPQDMDDPTKILGIIFKNIQEPIDIELYDFNIESKLIYVIEIPISYNRPHIIKNFKTKGGKEIQNYIPIRKSTSVYPADKFDLDLIYFEKKSTIKPLYKLEVYFKNNILLENRSIFSLTANILNTGVNVNFIASCKLYADEKVSPCLKITNDNKNYEFEESDYLKIPSNDMIKVKFIFESTLFGFLDLDKMNNIYLEYIDFKGIQYRSNNFSIKYRNNY